ncbi:hypothetical protein GGX14DRAFT_398400 [Mycena pura]|uniref:Uncharacterized protein n=1 Tax=Mycena pura TaxID=153505 RepID=A0AAD6VAC4_9AGAR|nr:hypothetical protein GGX14DRAFT_398400 [Mycena pura]
MPWKAQHLTQSYNSYINLSEGTCKLHINTEYSGPRPPVDELAEEPTGADEESMDVDAEREAGIFVNHANEIEEMRKVLGDFDFTEDDGNHGIKVYCRAVLLAHAYYCNISV